MNLFQHTQNQAGSEHPSLEQLNAFAISQLPDPVSSEVEQHLAVCTLCNQKLESSPDDTFVHLLQHGNSLVRSDPLAPIVPSRSPRFVPGYTLLEMLGEGGMGVVWKARQDGLNRLVALKRLRCAGAPTIEALARFHREAESVARLRHANIVQIHEVGEQDGEPYLALEYVGGGSLARELASGLLKPAQAAVLVETLARTMHHAHENGIVHRDLSRTTSFSTTTVRPDRRLRPGQAARRGVAQHANRDRPRHTQLHGARADRQRQIDGRPACRRVRPGAHLVRNTDWPAAFPWPLRPRHAGPSAGTRGGATPAASAQRAARFADDLPEMSAQRAATAL